MDFDQAKSFIVNKLEKELPAHLHYHSVEHTLDVYRAAEILADLEGVKGDELTLILTAALFHDSGFLIHETDHEEISCRLATEFLSMFNYSGDQIEHVCQMIMATRLPQTPHNLSAQIICDADLDYLGRDDFFVIGERLKEEFTFLGVIHNEEEWNRFQVRFLEHHHYFTDSANRLRAPTKEKHLRMIKNKIKDNK